MHDPLAFCLKIFQFEELIEYRIVAYDRINCEVIHCYTEKKTNKNSNFNLDQSYH